MVKINGKPVRKQNLIPTDPVPRTAWKENRTSPSVSTAVDYTAITNANIDKECTLCKRIDHKTGYCYIAKQQFGGEGARAKKRSDPASSNQVTEGNTEEARAKRKSSPTSTN